jgi:ABC-2 type transport system permease protein
MSIRKIRAVTGKEFYHLMRDYRSLILAFAIPLLLILLFGYALSLDVEHIRTVVIDQDRTLKSRDFVSHIVASRYFNVIAHEGDTQAVNRYIDYEDASLSIMASRCFTVIAREDDSQAVNRYLDYEDASLAFVIPPNWTHALDSDRPAPVQVILDGSDPNFANTSRGYVNAFISMYNRDLMTEYLNRNGITPINQPVDGRIRVWFNENLVSRNFILPGIVAVIIIIAGALLTSLVIAREYESGTMETLKSIPLGAFDFLAGKMIPYFLIAMTDVMVAIIMCQVLFNVVMKESFFIMVLASALYIMVAMSIGLILSTTIKNQMIANQAAILITYLPSFLLSNFVFPIDNMPKALQLITYIVPARYYISILSDIYMRHAGFLALWPNYVVLALIPVVLFTVNYMLLKKEGM